MQFMLIFESMIALVALLLIGFACRRLNVTTAESNKACSKVLMNILLPAVILHSAFEMETKLTAAELGVLLVIPFLVLIICFVLGEIAARLIGLKGQYAGLTSVMVMIMNVTFVGYPIIDLLYGAEGLFYASMTSVAFNFALYTLGVLSVNRGDRQKLSLKNVIKAPLVASLAGALIMLFDINAPKVVVNITEYLGSATVFLSMLVVGTSLGEVKVLEALKNWRIYVISFVRLILCPYVVWYILLLILGDGMIAGVLMIIAATPVGIVVTVVAIEYGKDEHFTSQTIFVSTVLSAVTMPVVIWHLLG